LGVVALIPSTAGGVRTPGWQLLDLFCGRSSPLAGLLFSPGAPTASELVRRVGVGPGVSATGPPGSPPPPLLHRLVNEALAAGDDYLGTSHLLLVLTTHAPPNQRLDGLDPVWVRARVYGRAALRQEDQSHSPLPAAMTPRLRSVIERAVHWA